ncbi:MAG TPA: flagellar hook-basal body complex protein FliE [Candidatus Tumulicola sp.]
MKVEPLIPDAPVLDAPSRNPGAGASDFARALDALGADLEGATAAEDAFANGGGSLAQAVYERARADVALSVATAAGQRSAQAVQSVLNMQV